MFNSTVSYNTGAHVGGILQQAGTFYLTNSTISQNLATVTTGAPAFGGILLTDITTNSQPYFYPRNSIIANNRATLPPARDVTGSVRSRGNNIFGNSLGMYLQETSPSDLIDVDPVIDFGLTSNGGPIPYHALAAGSPAIDSGNNCVLLTIAAGGCSDVALTTDIRGVMRPQDANPDGDPSGPRDWWPSPRRAIVTRWVPNEPIGTHCFSDAFFRFRLADSADHTAWRATRDRPSHGCRSGAR